VPARLEAATVPRISDPSSFQESWITHEQMTVRRPTVTELTHERAKPESAQEVNDMSSTEDELRELRRKIERILAEELRRHGFQV
jgi:hypothetical protein